MKKILIMATVLFAVGCGSSANTDLSCVIEGPDGETIDIYQNGAIDFSDVENFNDPEDAEKMQEMLSRWDTPQEQCAFFTGYFTVVVEMVKGFSEAFGGQ